MSDKKLAEEAHKIYGDNMTESQFKKYAEDKSLSNISDEKLENENFNLDEVITEDTIDSGYGYGAMEQGTEFD